MVEAGPIHQEKRLMSKRKSGKRAAGHGGSDSPSKAALDNRSRQLNPQHATYWSDRGAPPPDKSGGGNPPKVRHP